MAAGRYALNPTTQPLDQELPSQQAAEEALNARLAAMMKQSNREAALLRAQKEAKLKDHQENIAKMCAQNQQEQECVFEKNGIFDLDNGDDNDQARSIRNFNEFLILAVMPYLNLIDKANLSVACRQFRGLVSQDKAKHIVIFNQGRHEVKGTFGNLNCFFRDRQHAISQAEKMAQKSKHLQRLGTAAYTLGLVATFPLVGLITWGEEYSNAGQDTLEPLLYQKGFEKLKNYGKKAAEKSKRVADFPEELVTAATVDIKRRVAG